MNMSGNSLIDKIPNIINPKSDKCKLWKCNECWGVYIIFLIIVLIILIYGLYLLINYGTNNLATGDFMNKMIFKLPDGEPMSCWPLSHFILFLIVAFLFPNCWLLIIAAGILWEGVEGLVGKIMARPHHTTRTDNNIQYT